MLERFLISPLRARHLRRLFRSLKLTLLCLLLTLVVLRGHIGAGNFGTPEKDVEEIRDAFSSYIRHRRSEPHRVLKQSAGVADKNRVDVEINEIFNDEDDDGFRELKRDSNNNQPYALGPKIADWDQQRSDWMKKNPNFTGEDKNHKNLRVLLVTGSSPKPCENPVGDHYLLKSIKNKIDYCRLHGIEIFYSTALLDPEMSGFWAKLPLLRNLMLSHPEVEFLWWMDSDAMFTDMGFELPWERYRDSNLVIHGWEELVYEEKNWIGLNTGSFLLRNAQWSLDLLEALAPMGPEGKVREVAGELLTRELKGRPVFEADDQSAMVYVLATQREKWGDRVYIENGYYLHGYWKILVDKYEEMVGGGEESWPLVTHFVGCKPCGDGGSVERCLKEMDRAFNFGDNQVLKVYGFAHKSLQSRRVVRIREANGRLLSSSL